jgi:16S rRNA processing protein RimM
VTDDQQWVVLGKIAAAHGIQGEVKVTLFIDDAEFLRERKVVFMEGRPRKEYRLTRVRFTSDNLIVGLEGIEDRNAAELLRGRELVVPLDWLPPLEEDEYYVAQIVGLAVETVDGESLGTVEEVIFTGANEVYIIRGAPHGEILLPAIESVVQSVELEAGKLIVILPEGLVG